MDPLTHTLVGANLASTPVGGKTRLASAALVIGANLPDVDAILYFTGHDDLALGFRRGWTHGILAIVVLPLILAGLLLLYARLRRVQVSARWLLLLSFVGVLTHPALDWLNNYGMRWLMPFDGTWTYGDSVFIMDPWLWLVLGCGWLSGRRPSAGLIATLSVVTIGLAWVVGRRWPASLAIVAVVALLFLGALLWRTNRRLSTAALVVGAIYIVGRLLIHGATEARVRRDLGPAQRLMVSPHPIDPTRWEVVAQVADEYRYGRYAWTDGTLRLDEHRLPLPKETPEWRAARDHPSIRGFMTWARFPWYEIERTASNTVVFVHDARYTRRRTGRGFGGVTVVLPR